MNRFFVNSGAIEGSIVNIKNGDATHIRKVLRLKQGDIVEISDCAGTDYTGIIKSVNEEDVVVSLKNSRPAETEPKTKVSVYQCLPKGSKMETVIQKCVELGAYEFIPVQSSRCVVKLKNSLSKQLRWQKIAYEAAKQSKRGIIPQVKYPAELKEIIPSCNSDLKIIAWENEGKQTINYVMDSVKNSISSIAILIGPEGGFDDSEVEFAKRYGFMSISLGPRILRTETASLCLLSIIMYHMEEMKCSKNQG